jgi:MarR family transcriptional regulator, transcriptional regulator for hemolysin
MHTPSNKHIDDFPTGMDQITFLFDDVPRMHRKAIDAVLIEQELSRTQWRLLAYALLNEGITQTALAQKLELERASVGQAIDSLEKKNLLKRAKASGDRRVWRIMPTEKAKQLLPKVRETVDEIYEMMFSGFTDDEIETLRGFLGRIVNNLSR